MTGAWHCSLRPHPPSSRSLLLHTYAHTCVTEKQICSANVSPCDGKMWLKRRERIQNCQKRELSSGEPRNGGGSVGGHGVHEQSNTRRTSKREKGGGRKKRNKREGRERDGSTHRYTQAPSHIIARSSMVHLLLLLPVHVGRHHRTTWPVARCTAGSKSVC